MNLLDHFSLIPSTQDILLKDKIRPRIKFDNLKNVPDILRQNLKLLQY